MSDPADDVGTAEAVLLAGARAGVEDAFTSLAEPYVRELRAHCYRMLGSLHDAEDALQDTLVRAWRHLGRFEGRSTLRAWLYRIATNVCLSAAVRRRTEDEPLRLTPIPDAFLDELPSIERGPAAQYDLEESVQLAFLATIQLLPPRQRAVLILRDVLAFSASEVADQLDVSVASVNSALQRARISLERERGKGRLIAVGAVPSDTERSLLRRFIEAWEAVDIDRLVALLKEDAVLTMPPFPMRFVGRGQIGEFLARSLLAVRSTGSASSPFMRTANPPSPPTCWMRKRESIAPTASWCWRWTARRSARSPGSRTRRSFLISGCRCATRLRTDRRMPFDEQLAARVRKALSQRDDVSEQRMFGGLTFMVAGHMCCGVVGDRLMVRLGPEGTSKALGKPHTSPMTFTGRALKGFVYVDADGARSGPALQSWVRRAVAFVTTLPGK